MIAQIYKYDPKKKPSRLENYKKNYAKPEKTKGGDMGGGSDGLEPRVARLEDSVARIEKDVLELKTDVHDLKIDVAGIKSQLQHFATKSDLSDMKADMIKWIVGTALAMSAAGITVMTFVLNNAIPKNEKTAQAPIIIHMPAASPALAPEQILTPTEKSSNPK